MVDDTQLNQKLAKFGMHLEFWRVEELKELAKKTKNPKKHYNKDIEALSSVIGDLGFKNMVYINKEGTEIGAGVGRILASDRNGLDELPVIRILDLDKTKFKKFRISDNRTNQLSDKWNEDILIADLSELKHIGDDISWMNFEKYDKLLSTVDAADLKFIDQSQQNQYDNIPTQELGGQPVRPQIREDEAGLVSPSPAPKTGTAPAVKDINSAEFAVDFSSSNEWGIPDLSEKYQATAIPRTVVKWGEVSYKKEIENLLWTFYVDDEKFIGIPDNPMKALMAMPVALVELNYSTYPTLPNALAIGQVFFKRWVSRFWQSKGFPIIVDLNVLPQFSKMNLIGVPPGWKAYATRGSGELEWIKHDWEVACQHSGADEDDIVFLVYGGGKEAQALCRDHHWNFVPERLQVVSNPDYAGMDGLDIKVTSDKYKDIK